MEYEYELRDMTDDNGNYILDTADKLPCRGEGFISLLVLWAQSILGFHLKPVDYSHIAVVIRFTREMINAMMGSGKLSGKVLVWLGERKIDGKDDLVAVGESNEEGVHLTEMSKWIKAYKGKVWWRRLIMSKPKIYDGACAYYGNLKWEYYGNLKWEKEFNAESLRAILPFKGKTSRTPEMIAASLGYLEKTLGLPYEDLLELIRTASMSNTQPDTSDFSCSEWAAGYDKAIKILRPELLENNIIPQHYAFGNLIEEEMKYSAEPACLQKEMIIDN